MKFNYYLFLFYLIIFPFYFFERGNPQIADLFGVILITINIKPIILGIKSSAFTKLLFLFVLYTLIVNAIFMVLYRDMLFLKSSMYYLYSFFMSLLFLSKLKDKTFLNFIFFGILISLSIQFLLWPFIGNQGVRTHMFFKDPNQLSFWSFSMLIISYLISTFIKPKTHLVLAALLLSTFFIFISASKSGIVGSLIFWMFFLINSGRKLIAFVGAGIIVLSFLIVLKKIDFSNIDVVNNVIGRLSEKKHPGKQGLEGRGYDRVLRFPQYLFFGAGEGQNERFNERIEIHSTFINILFSYGIIGFTLFMLAIFNILRGSRKDVALILLIIILYTLAHMTLRSPLFWISLMLLFVLNTAKFQSTKTTLIYD